MDNTNNCKSNSDCQREKAIMLFQALADIDDRFIVESMRYLVLDKNQPLGAKD